MNNEILLKKEKATKAVKITPTHHEILEKLRKIEEEPFHKVLDRILNFYLNECDDISEEKIKELENRVKEVNEGKVYSTKEIKEKLFGKKRTK